MLKHELLNESWVSAFHRYFTEERPELLTAMVRRKHYRELLDAIGVDYSAYDLRSVVADS